MGLLEELGIQHSIPQAYLENKDSILKLVIPFAFFQEPGTGMKGVDGAYAFIDHIGFLQFHVMQKCTEVKDTDFTISSSLWPLLWTKGPVISRHPDRNEISQLCSALHSWRSKSQYNTISSQFKRLITSISFEESLSQMDSRCH